MKRPACFDGWRGAAEEGAEGGGRRGRRTAVRLSAVALVLSLVGCFRYLPVEPRAVPDGRQVRVEMTRLGFAALPEIPGQAGPRLAGTITGQNDEQLLMLVPVAVLQDGSEIGRELEIPTRDVVRVEVREVSRVRTGMLIASGLAAGLALYLGFEKGSPTTARDGEDQEIEGSLLTRALFSIRVR